VRDTDITHAIWEFVLDYEGGQTTQLGEPESTSRQLIHPHGLALNLQLPIRRFINRSLRERSRAKSQPLAPHAREN
jgi:hypothetical protein